MQSMSIATIVIASAMLASCSDKGPKRALDPAVEVSGIPAHLGDSRKEVLKHMGVPNAFLSADGFGEILGGEMGSLLMPSGEKIPGPDLTKDPQLFSTKYWKYYGYGSPRNFASIHFDGDKVVGIRHEKTTRPMRTPYD